MRISKKVLYASFIVFISLSFLFLLLYKKKPLFQTEGFEIAKVGNDKVFLEEFLTLYKNMRKEYSPPSLNDPKLILQLKNLSLETLIYEKLNKAFIKAQYPRLSSVL